MSTGYSVYLAPQQRDCVIKIDGNGVSLLALELAASIERGCKANPPEKVRDGEVTGEVYELVKLLYSIVEAAVTSNLHAATVPYYNRADAKAITDALSAYQEWRNKWVHVQQNRLGHRWGSALPFVRQDWTFYNNKFLALFPAPVAAS